MKKYLLLFAFFLAAVQFSNAQIDFGLKAGVNYNNNGDLESTANNVIEGADARSGFHAGIWFRGKLPILGLYLRPELIYTEVKSEYDFNGVVSDYNFRKLDVPVLLGKKVFGFANAFIGPSFQYIIQDNFSFNNLTTDEFDKFSVGMQMGFGVEFGAIGLDVRWERGLSNTEANFVGNNTNITVDNRTNQIIFGLSVRL